MFWVRFAESLVAVLWGFGVDFGGESVRFGELFACCIGDYFRGLLGSFSDEGFGGFWSEKKSLVWWSSRWGFGADFVFTSIKWLRGT